MATPPKRHGFHQAMAMTGLPDGNGVVRRFVSHQPAWTPGEDLPADIKAKTKIAKRAFGGHVYIQAALAAARVVQREQPTFGIHSIQGVFTLGGLSDRPFIYDVSDLASTHSFLTRLTTVRQPPHPSSQPGGPFPAEDGVSRAQDACFTCITTFRPTKENGADVQASPPQERFADILSQRRAEEWQPSPQIDLDRVPVLTDSEHGTFPILDMYKVDMTGWNKGKPLPERRELILYRLCEALDEGDVNAHVLCHAFGADRNGLLMLANHLGWGRTVGSVASLSYAFYVHSNAEEAVMKEGWWVQEVRWARVGAGRGTMESSIWSPGGRHVATGYQDGICVNEKL